jgi:hypothetical protein
LPLRFEANRGQTDERVRFVSRGRGYTLFLTSTETVLSLISPQSPQRPQRRDAPVSSALSAGSAVNIRLQLIGANPNAEVVARDELPGKSNYFIGNDPSKWRTNVPNYAKVEYRQVYPGVDLVYYGNGRQLEHDFVVAPGADPRVIRLGIQGADKLEVDAAGDLVLHAGGGAVRLRKPVVYQEVGGVRQEVSGAYVVRPSLQSEIRNPKSAIGFEIAAYDPTRPLVIDPVLVYSTYLGGSGDDYGHGIAVDAAGNAYVIGSTGVFGNFPTVGPLQSTIGGGRDVFVAKLNAAGSALLYSTYLGGSDWDEGSAIAVDSAGNAYVTGSTVSGNFPTASPPLEAAFSVYRAYHAFVAKLNASGSALLYSTYLGGNVADYGNGIAVDSAGNAYVVGETASTNFPTASPLQPAYGGGNYDAFVAKVNAAGSALVYSTYLGGSGQEAGRGIAVDSAGNAYVTGYTYSTNFPTASPLQAAFGGGACGSDPCYDAFVVKLNGAGSALVYSTYLGGSGSDGGCSIAVDAGGNAYVTGSTNSTDFPMASPLQAAFGGGNFDAFVAKLNAAGSALFYSTYLGGSGNDGGYGIAVDFSTNVYVTGYTGSTNFPVAAPLQSASGAGDDAFIAKISSTPKITLLTPSTGVPGSGSFILSVRGENFLPTATLQWNGSNRTVLSSTPTDLEVLILASDIATAGTAPVTVNNDDGSPVSNALTFTIGTPNPLPVIALLSPSSAVAGGAAFTLTVNGSSFVTGSVVQWNGANKTTTVVSSTQLTATITAADITAAGTALVTVSNPPMGGGVSNPLLFAINTPNLPNPLPAISSMWPAIGGAGGPAFTLSIAGSNFVPASTVQWNGTARPTTFVNSTQLMAAIAAGDIGTAGTAQVTVFNPPPGGGTSTAQAFTITASSGGAVTPGAAQGSPGGTLRIPVMLVLASGVTVDSVAFGLQITPNSGAPPLSGSLSFVTDPALSAPSQVDAAAAPNLISVTWLGLTTPLSGTVWLGDVAMIVPASAAVAQTYSVAITGASGSLDTTPIALPGGTPATLTVVASYLVGDVFPFIGNNSGQFGDGTLNVVDLIYALRAVTNIPGFRPPACSDRFDAMDSNPLDTDTVRGGDGVLGVLDLIRTLRRVTTIDTSRPVRASRGLCTAGAGFTEMRFTTSIERPEAQAAGLEFGEAEAGAGGKVRIPLYLVARGGGMLAGVSFAVELEGEARGPLSFMANDAVQRPSLVDDGLPGFLALAWLDAVRLRPGQRLLLGWVETAAPAPVFRILGFDAPAEDAARTRGEIQ